eukprot:scaffold609_cov170-Amphora_coffeaeformis.AAC.1
MVVGYNTRSIIPYTTVPYQQHSADIKGNNFSGVKEETPFIRIRTRPKCHPHCGVGDRQTVWRTEPRWAMTPNRRGDWALYGVWYGAAAAPAHKEASKASHEIDQK